MGRPAVGACGSWWGGGWASQQSPSSGTCSVLLTARRCGSARSSRSSPRHQSCQTCLVRVGRRRSGAAVRDGGKGDGGKQLQWLSGQLHRLWVAAARCPGCGSSSAARWMPLLLCKVATASPSQGSSARQARQTDQTPLLSQAHTAQPSPARSLAAAAAGGAR